MEPQDRLAPAHYRFIKAISVDDPMPLTPQGASAVRVRYHVLAMLPCLTGSALPLTPAAPPCLLALPCSAQPHTTLPCPALPLSGWL